MKRRNWVLGAAGATAAGAGAGWQLWRAPAAAAVPAGGVLDEATSTFWQMSFARPDGQPLPMAGLRGKPLVLNFWATWCPPCVKEMPELERFDQARRASGWQVVGLAVDGPTPVRQFLDRVAIAFPIGLAGLEGTDLSRRLGNATGALPFTIVFDKDGQPLHRKLGETSFDELERWAAAR